MTKQYTDTTAHILALYKEGMDSYDIVVKIVEEWDTTPMRASVMVDYVLDSQLYPKVKREED